MVIQIVDPDMSFPLPKYPFKTSVLVRFLDDDSISDTQANFIAMALLNAQRDKMNVVVHCVAGICRSGAVVEAAMRYLGYTPVEKFRNPNITLLQKLSSRLQKEVSSC